MGGTAQSKIANTATAAGVSGVCGTLVCMGVTLVSAPVALVVGVVVKKTTERAGKSVHRAWQESSRKGQTTAAAAAVGAAVVGAAASCVAGPVAGMLAASIVAPVAADSARKATNTDVVQRVVTVTCVVGCELLLPVAALTGCIIGACTAVVLHPDAEPEVRELLARSMLGVALGGVCTALYPGDMLFSACCVALTSPIVSWAVDEAMGAPPVILQPPQQVLLRPVPTAFMGVAAPVFMLVAPEFGVGAAVFHALWTGIDTAAIGFVFNGAVWLVRKEIEVERLRHDFQQEVRRLFQAHVRQ